MMKQLNWWHLIFFLVAITVIDQLTGPLGGGAAKNPEIRVVASSQDAQGVTQQDFELNFLKNLEADTVELVKLKAKEYLASHGQPNTQFDIVPEAMYVENGPMKLAVIHLRNPDGSYIGAIIFGIIGNELKRVGCMGESLQSIPITYGVCAEKINEVFGTRFGG